MSDGRCVTDADCHDNGDCQGKEGDERCLCHPLTGGDENCSEKFTDDRAWTIVYQVHQAVFVLLFGLMLVYCFRCLRYLLVVHRKAPGRSRPKLPLTLCLLMSFGFVLRLSYVALQFTLYTGNSLERGIAFLLFSLPFVCWLSFATLLLIFWIELDYKKLPTAFCINRFLRPVLVAVFFLIFLIMVPLSFVSIWNGTFGVVFFLIQAPVLLLLITLMFLFAWKTRRRLRESLRFASSEADTTAVRSYLRRINAFLLAIWPLTILTVVILLAFFTYSMYKWPYLFLGVLARLLELVGGIVSIFVIHSRAKDSSSSTGTSAPDRSGSGVGGGGLEGSRNSRSHAKAPSGHSTEATAQSARSSGVSEIALPTLTISASAAAGDDGDGLVSTDAPSGTAHAEKAQS